MKLFTKHNLLTLSERASFLRIEFIRTWLAFAGRQNARGLASIVTTICLLNLHLAFAEPIYQWVDGEGRTHYGSSAPDDAIAPSNLPEIKRENFDSKIADIKANTPTTCNTHRGIDCSRGPDTDGSVICADGFLEAINPFAFFCNEARLQTQLLILIEGNEEFIKHSTNLQGKLKNKKITGLQLTARNISDVEAFGVKISLTMSVRGKQIGVGPDKIPPFSSAEYLFPFENITPKPTIIDIEKAKYVVSCTNCGVVKKGAQ